MLRKEPWGQVLFLLYQYTGTPEMAFQHGRIWCVFSKVTFINPLRENGFHVISRFRNNSVLFHSTLEIRTRKRGRPKLHDGKIDFENLDTSRCTEYTVNKGRLYGLQAYSKVLRHFVSLAVWYPMDGRTDKWQLYFFTNETQNIQDVLEFYRTLSNPNFAFAIPSNMPGWRTVSQQTSENWHSTPIFHLQQ